MTAPPSTRFSRRRIAVAAGFVVVALATAAVLIALALTQEAPRWWAHVDADDPATIDLAQRVENGITTALTQVRPPTPEAAGAQTWKVFITTEQANAWLASRLRRWLADKAGEGATDLKLPSEIEQVEASFQDGLVYIGARVVRRGPAGAGAGAGGGRPPSNEKPQTFAAAIRPEFKPDGSLWMTAQSVQIGRLGLPASWVIGSAAKARTRIGEVSGELADMPQTQRVLAVLKGERPVVVHPVIKLADGRRVRVLALEPVEGKVIITCQTEQREPKAAKK